MRACRCDTFRRSLHELSPPTLSNPISLGYFFLCLAHFFCFCRWADDECEHGSGRRIPNSHSLDLDHVEVCATIIVSTLTELQNQLSIFLSRLTKLRAKLPPAEPARETSPLSLA